MKFDEDGRELPDATPIEVPVHLRRPESLSEQIKRLIRTDMSRMAVEQGDESFEQANDFDMEEDDAELAETHHELVEEVVDAELEVRRERKEAAAAAEKKGDAARASSRSSKRKRSDVDESGGKGAVSEDAESGGSSEPEGDS